MLLSTPVQIAFENIMVPRDKKPALLKDEVDVSADFIDDIGNKNFEIFQYINKIKELKIFQLIDQILNTIFTFLTAGIDSEIMIKIMFYFFVVKEFLVILGLRAPL